MFLAIKEIRYSKLRYGLIVGIMFLIAYVVFMLSGLANGLSEEFKKAIDDWDAQEIVLSEDANQVFAASQLTRGDLKYIEGGEKAPIGLYSGAIKGKNKENVTVFGTTKEAFLLPKLTKGHEFKQRMKSSSLKIWLIQAIKLRYDQNWQLRRSFDDCRYLS